MASILLHNSLQTVQRSTIEGSIVLGVKQTFRAADQILKSCTRVVTHRHNNHSYVSMFQVVHFLDDLCTDLNHRVKEDNCHLQRLIAFIQLIRVEADMIEMSQLSDNVRVISGQNPVFQGLPYFSNHAALVEVNAWNE